MVMVWVLVRVEGTFEKLKSEPLGTGTLENIGMLVTLDSALGGTPVNGLDLVGLDSDFRT